MRNRRTLANGNCGARLGVDDHTILNVRIRTDEDGLHVAVFIDLVGTDHCVGANENIFIYENPTTKNGSMIDKRTFMDDWHVATWVFADHLADNSDFMICIIGSRLGTIETLENRSARSGLRRGVWSRSYTLLETKRIGCLSSL